jgi:DNA-binding XRE family transcriptional regulator
MNMAIVELNDWDIGPALKLLRVTHNFTKAHVAREIGMSGTAVSSHERFAVRPHMHAMTKYCQLYGIEFYQLYHLMAHIKAGTKPVIKSDITKYAIRHMIQPVGD